MWTSFRFGGEMALLHSFFVVHCITWQLHHYSLNRYLRLGLSLCAGRVSDPGLVSMQLSSALWPKCHQLSWSQTCFDQASCQLIQNNGVINWANRLEQPDTEGDGSVDEAPARPQQVQLILGNALAHLSGMLC